MNTPESALHKRVTVALILANLCVLTLYVSGWSRATLRPAARQNMGRAVVRELPLDNEPVEIGDLKVKGKPFKLGDRFINGEDTWLKEVVFKVKNKSKKPITYVRLDLTFPETTATGNVLFHQVFLGRRPDIPSLRSNKPLMLAPHESMDVSLAPEFDQVKRMIEFRHSAVGTINEVVVRLGEAMFEDGTLYSGGALFRRNPDPSSPRKWVILNEQQ